MGDLYGDAFSLSPSDEPGGGGPGSVPFRQPAPGSVEDLAYQVEIRNRSDDTLQQTLAVTASVAIGYAAFYAATREFPEQLIVLRHKGAVLNRWSGQRH